MSDENHIRLNRSLHGLLVLLACGIIGFTFFSCATGFKQTINPKYDYQEKSAESGSFAANLNSGINKITYDDALMTWGQPTSVFDGDQIFLATWSSEKTGGAVFPIGKTWFAMPIQSGWRLQLAFNKITRKLVGWKYDKW